MPPKSTQRIVRLGLYPEVTDALRRKASSSENKTATAITDILEEATEKIFPSEETRQQLSDIDTYTDNLRRAKKYLKESASDFLGESDLRVLEEAGKVNREQIYFPKLPLKTQEAILSGARKMGCQSYTYADHVLREYLNVPPISQEKMNDTKTLCEKIDQQPKIESYNVGLLEDSVPIDFFADDALRSKFCLTALREACSLRGTAKESLLKEFGEFFKDRERRREEQDKIGSKKQQPYTNRFSFGVPGDVHDVVEEIVQELKGRTESENVSENQGERKRAPVNVTREAFAAFSIERKCSALFLPMADRGSIIGPAMEEERAHAVGTEYEKSVRSGIMVLRRENVDSIVHHIRGAEREGLALQEFEWLKGEDFLLAS